MPAPPQVPGLPPRKGGGRSIDWASLMRRVFLLKVLACACGARRRVIAAIEPGPTAKRILEHLGLPTSTPGMEPSRVSQAELWPTGPPTTNLEEPPVHDEFECAASRFRGQRLPPHLDVA